MCKLVPEELFPPPTDVFDEKILSSFLWAACSFCLKLCVGRKRKALFQFYCQAEYSLQRGPWPSESAAKVSTLLSHRGNRGAHKHRPDNKGHFYHVSILEFFPKPKLKLYSAYSNKNTAGSTFTTVLESFLFHTFPLAAVWDFETFFIPTVVLLFYNSAARLEKLHNDQQVRKSSKSRGRILTHPHSRCFQIPLLTFEQRFVWLVSFTIFTTWLYVTGCTAGVCRSKLLCNLIEVSKVLMDAAWGCCQRWKIKRGTESWTVRDADL